MGLYLLLQTNQVTGEAIPHVFTEAEGRQCEDLRGMLVQQDCPSVVWFIPQQDDAHPFGRKPWLIAGPNDFLSLPKPETCRECGERFPLHAPMCSQMGRQVPYEDRDFENRQQDAEIRAERRNEYALEGLQGEFIDPNPPKH